MAEKEYIEREAAIDAVKKERNYTGKFTFEEEHAWAVGFQQGITFALSDIAAIPAADVRPVVRGRWIRHYEQADTGEDIIAYPCGWVCSECGRWESEDEPFCNCGAMMEES